MYVRFKDDNGVWSVPVAEYIYLQRQQKITAYRYWFNKSIMDAHLVSVNPPTTDYVLNLALSENELSRTSQDTVYFQFQSQNGQWSVPVGEILSLCGVGGITNTNIRNLKPYINKPVYEVMESGTVHHYFQLTNCNNIPIKDVKISYKLSNRPNETFVSGNSDSRGIVDLEIKLGGDNPLSNSDDIAKVGDNITITFSTISSGVSSVFQNDFDPFTVKVTKFKADNIVFGGFVTGKIKIEGCAECLQYGPLGAKGISLSEGTGGGFSLDLSKMRIIILV